MRGESYNELKKNSYGKFMKKISNLTDEELDFFTTKYNSWKSSTRLC